jgi:outer membrane protein OmpA-like peptidoglycan-associated protein
MKVSAKCMNHSGCLRAYRGETIELDPGTPLICPECGKPLVKVGGGAQGALKAAAILVIVLVVIVAGALGYKMMKKKNAESEASSTPTPELASTPPPPSSRTTASTATPAPPSSSAEPAAAPAVNEPPPAAPVPTDEAVTPQVRQEVLTRIDKMPNLSPEKKDRLYNSVQRARDMRKLVEISFSSGQTQMPGTSAAQVKKLLEDPAVMKFRDDLTAVFVVLGFADSKGNEKSNYDISEKRAKSVVDYMEKQCGVKNVTHAVGMGGTNLVDKNNAAKNRIAEIWAVLP